MMPSVCTIQHLLSLYSEMNLNIQGKQLNTPIFNSFLLFLRGNKWNVKMATEYESKFSCFDLFLIYQLHHMLTPIKSGSIYLLFHNFFSMKHHVKFRKLFVPYQFFSPRSFYVSNPFLQPQVLSANVFLW